MPTTKFGDAFQLAFVPRDFDGALAHWLTLGAGPFFVAERREFEKSIYRGRSCQTAIKVALGYWGDFQIELIQQLDDGPSSYRTWLEEGREGVHHMAFLAPDLDEARARCRQAGYAIDHEITSSGMDLFYARPASPDLPIIECMSPGPAMLAFYEMMKTARRDWDGSDPIRKR